MVKEDNWCPAPLMAYGLVPMPDNPSALNMNPYAHFEYGKYIGILSAPLDIAAFEPEVVLIYADTDKLRTMLLSMRNEDRPGIKYNFFPFSCAYSVTDAIINGEYWINLPDPGEMVRALVLPGEMLFSIPAVKLEGFMADLKAFFDSSMYANEQMMMRPDFPQPDLYKKVFGAWGMEHEE